MKNYKALVIGVTLSCYANTALAQDSDEIIVTANKRDENINKVGMSIVAISADTLKEKKISSLEDIASLVPGLSFAPSSTNTPILTLRGVGFNESSLGVYPAVSAYVDQVPLPFAVLASHAAFDLERVEVLKGPQGTLFGQNSTGGAINYIAAKPTDAWVAGGDISYGRFNSIEGNAYVSGPITDTLGVRVAANGLNSDDWQKSYTRRDTNGHQSYIAGRMLLEWKPTTAVNLLLNLNGWVDKSQPQAPQLIAVHEQGTNDPLNSVGASPVVEALRSAFSPPLNGAPTGQLGYPFPSLKPRFADWSTRFLDPDTGVTDPNTGASDPTTANLSDYDPFSDRKFWQASLRADIVLTDDLTLTSLTSYTKYKQKQATEGDGMSYVSFNFHQRGDHINSFNQELRLANDQSSQFRWVMGANYENSETFEDQSIALYSQSVYKASNLYINHSNITNLQKIENYAFFSSGEYSLNESLILKAAARYTNSRNKANLCSYTNPNGNVDKFFNFLGGLIGSVSFTPIGPSDCYTLNENNVPGEPFARTLKEDNVSWRVGLDYQITPEVMVYGNVSRGYKAGSFPTLAAAGQVALEPVTQESVTAYEVGLKGRSSNRAVSFNAAAFYYDYRDKQVRGRLFDFIFGSLETLVNVPKSRVYGAEFDIIVRPVEGLTISTAATYINSKITNYEGYDVYGGIGNVNFDPTGINSEDLSGNPLPYAPKWSGSVSVDYRVPNLSAGTPFAGFTVNAKSSQDTAIAGGDTPLPVGPRYRLAPGASPYVNTIDGYATVDARIGFESADENWRVMFWGKNIFNKYYWTSTIAVVETTARLTGRPATYGVTVGFKM